MTMRKWEAIGGGTLWAMVAILMVSAALQPVEVSAAIAGETVRVASLCPDGSSSLVMGCDSIHL
jgi:hypothetical protein